MVETIRKLDNIFLFMFGLGLAGACVGLTALCACGRAEKFWESFTLGSAVVCMCGFLLRNITAAEKRIPKKGRGVAGERRRKGNTRRSAGKTDWATGGWIAEIDGSG